jgi:putrescine aminotransferase
MVADEIADVLIEAGYLAHGFTYSGHPMSCAAALANIDILERDKLIPLTANDLGPYFQKKLREFSTHPAVAEVRGEQLIGALELVPKGGKSALTPTSFLGVHAAKRVRDEGVIVRGIRDLIAMAPPLTATHAEVDFLFEAVRKGLDRLW